LETAFGSLVNFFASPLVLTFQTAGNDCPFDNGTLPRLFRYPAASNPIRLRRHIMRKQSLLAGAMAAMFILAAATASFAADRRGPHRGYRYGNGKHFAPKPYGSHWKRGAVPRYNRGWHNGRAYAPRHRLQHRAPTHHPRFQGPRHPYGQHRSDRQRWRQNPSNHHRPGRFDHDSTRQGFGGRNQSDRRRTDGAVASDNSASRQGERHEAGRQR
jgi:hypothetical protein